VTYSILSRNTPWEIRSSAAWSRSPYNLTISSWNSPIPALTKFTPGHDARIEVTDDNRSPDGVNIRIKFSDLMDCDSVSKSIMFNLTPSGEGFGEIWLGCVFDDPGSNRQASNHP